MIRADRDRLIERYMNGQMTQAEEEAFFINAAVNPELRQELKAHRLVETAVRKDRDGLTAGHAALRNRVAATLAAATPTPAMETAAPHAGTLMERVAGAVATHPAVTAIIAGLLAIGTVILQPWESTSDNGAAGNPAPALQAPPATAPQPNVEAQQAMPNATTTRPAATDPGVLPAKPVQSQSSVGNSPDASAAAQRTPGRVERTATAEKRQHNDPAAISSPAGPASAARTLATPPATKKPDSINVGIRIDVSQPTTPR
ncbi:MAG: hypothetical protein DYG96_02510 [Chlorobi bacterium CHB2]|nr:hypothetical protein [Chlorobi bacterium CHB2]